MSETGLFFPLKNWRCKRIKIDIQSEGNDERNNQRHYDDSHRRGDLFMQQRRG